MEFQADRRTNSVIWMENLQAGTSVGTQMQMSPAVELEGKADLKPRSQTLASVSAVSAAVRVSLCLHLNRPVRFFARGGFVSMDLPSSSVYPLLQHHPPFSSALRIAAWQEINGSAAAWQENAALFWQKPWTADVFWKTGRLLLRYGPRPDQRACPLRSSFAGASRWLAVSKWKWNTHFSL